MTGGESLPRVPGYECEALIGRGGMGLVYRALETDLGRLVALKVITPELATEERFRSRFLRESRLAASLDHPNVIPIYAAGEANGSLYLAMRYVDGSDLRTVLRRDGALERSRALGIVRQLAGALDAAHRRGLVHRDVKPSNVLLEEGGHAYLSDFGLSKRLTGEQTQTGQFVGTLDYLAPEQIRGEPLDGRTDQYALACLLYECLLGTPPFRRETEAETLWAHVQEAPPSPVGHADLSPVFARALAKSVEDRYASCADLAAAAERPTASRAGRRPLRIRLRRRPSRRVTAVAGVLAVAAGAAIAAVLLLARGGAHAAPDSVLAFRTRDAHTTAVVRVGSSPLSVATGSGLVWVVGRNGRTLSAVDPSSNAVIRVLDLHGRARSQWAGGGLAAGATDFITLTDSSTLDIVTLPASSLHAFGALTVSRTSLFESGAPDHVCAAFLTGSGPRVWYSRGRRLVEIDAQTQLVVRRTTLPAVTSPARTCYGVEFTGGSLFAVRTPDGAVGYLDAATGSFKPIVSGIAGLTARAGAVQSASWAAGFGALWVLSPTRLVEADLRTGKVVRRIAVGSGGGTLAVDASGVWLVDGSGRTLYRVDPASGRVVSATRLRYRACCLVSGFGRLWLGLGSA